MPAFLRYIGHRLYTIWATFWFVMPFVVTYPVQWLLNRLGRRRELHALNRAWARLSIFMWGVPVEVVRESAAPVPQPCIYLSNHGSYVDILLLFKTIPGFLNMMGKDSLARTPLWGPLFAGTYVVVNRGSAVARGRSFAQARQELLQGRSLAIFPEGTIGDKPGEALGPLLDGAFQLAISTGIPIVPVSMPLNHKFMPSVKGLRVRYAKLRIVFHAPIETSSLTIADIPTLKTQVAAQITDDFLPEGRGIPAPSTWR